MNTKPTLARPRFLPCFIAALLSAVISAGLLGAVSGLFHSDGIPFGKVVAAERTCRDHALVSEREECVRFSAPHGLVYDPSIDDYLGFAETTDGTLLPAGISSSGQIGIAGYAKSAFVDSGVVESFQWGPP